MMNKTNLAFFLGLVSCFVVAPVQSVVGRYNGRARSQNMIIARRDCDRTKHGGWRRSSGQTVGVHNSIANKWSRVGTRQFNAQRQLMFKGNLHGTIAPRRHIISRGPIISGLARNSNRIIPRQHHTVARRPHKGRSYHVTRNIYQGLSHMKQSSRTEHAVSAVPTHILEVSKEVPIKPKHHRNPTHQVYITKTIHIRKPVVIAHKAPTPKQPLNVVHLITVLEKKRELLSKIGPKKLFKPFSLIHNVCKTSHKRYRSPYLCFYATRKCHNTRCTLSGGVCDLSGPCSYPFCEVSCVKPKCIRRPYSKRRVVCPATKTPMTSYRCINDHACPRGSVCCHQPTGSECVSQSKFKISF